MDEFREAGQDFGRVGAKIVKVLQDAQGFRHLAAHEGFEKINNPAAISEPQHRAQGFRRDRRAGLALRRARDEAQRLRLDRDGLLGADQGKIIRQHMRLDAAQIEPLAAGAHSDRNLFDLGRREQKFHMIGRLFQGFQETVESLFGEHMHFVDNIDFCACHDWLVACALDDLAHIIDPGMRGGVHFDDIDMARFDDRLAMHA